MSKFATFERDLKLATAGMEPAEMNRQLARFARGELAKVLASGQASPIFVRFVNGREGADEDTVQAPGPILYEFSNWQQIITFALNALEERAPKLSRDFVKSFRVMVGGQVMRRDASIAADEEVTIVATEPYSRKIESGHMRMRVPHGVFKDVRKIVKAQFGAALEVRDRMILIPNGYVLKGRFRRGYRPHARIKLRADTDAGERLTYPALVMSLR